MKALPTHDASKVRASGPGLNTTGVPASLPVEFTIDAKDAGEGLLAVQITVPGGFGGVWGGRGDEFWGFLGALEEVGGVGGARCWWFL